MLLPTYNDKSVDVSSTTVIETTDGGDDYNWSDEDLLTNNPFLIEATQNPEKFLCTSNSLVKTSSSEVVCLEEISKTYHYDSFHSLMSPQKSESTISSNEMIDGLVTTSFNLSSVKNLKNSFKEYGSCVNEPTPLVIEHKHSVKETIPSVIKQSYFMKEPKYTVKESCTPVKQLIPYMNGPATHMKEFRYSVKEQCSSNKESSYSVNEHCSSNKESSYSVNEHCSSNKESSYSVNEHCSSNKESSYSVKSPSCSSIKEISFSVTKLDTSLERSDSSMQLPCFSVEESSPSLSQSSTTASTINKSQNFKRSSSCRNIFPARMPVCISSVYFKDAFKSPDTTNLSLSTDGNLKPVSAICFSSSILLNNKFTQDINRTVNQTNESLPVSQPSGVNGQTFQEFSQTDQLSTKNKYDPCDSWENFNSSFKKIVDSDKSQMNCGNTGPLYKTNRLSTHSISSYPFLIPDLKYGSPNVFQPKLTQTGSLEYIKLHSNLLTSNELQIGNITSTGSYLPDNDGQVCTSDVSKIKDDGYDVSISDDNLQKMLQSDIFDSQTGFISTPPASVTKETDLSDVCNEITSTFATTLDVALPQTVNSVVPDELKNTLTEADYTHCDTFSADCKHPGKPNLTGSSLTQRSSPANTKSLLSTNSPKHFTFKEIMPIQKSSHMKDLVHWQSTFPSQCMPVKDSKFWSDVSKGKIAETFRKKCSASMTDSSFNESFISDEDEFESQVLPLLDEMEVSMADNSFDDIFISDEDEFESQILPLLDKMEGEIIAETKSSVCKQDKQPPKEIEQKKNISTAIKQTSVGFEKIVAPIESFVHSQVKCSPEEIELKRLSALRIRSLRVSQIKHTS